MINWLLDFIPLWLWILLGIVALVAAWRLLGLKGMLAALAAIVTVGAFRAGRQSGSADALARQRKADEKAVKDHDRIKAETDRMSEHDLDRDNARWVRKRGR